MYARISPLALILVNLLFAAALTWLNGRVVERRATQTPGLLSRVSRATVESSGVTRRAQSLNAWGLARYEEHIVAASRRYGVDPYLVKAIILVESAGDPWAVSRKDARGLMQLLPSTGRGLGVLRSEYLFDPRLNIELGARYLAELLAFCSGNVPCALAAYNAGPGAVLEGKLSAETRAYVPRVLRLWAELTGTRQPRL
jgi:soluble lytic murein transglycosylase-like protein